MAKIIADGLGIKLHGKAGNSVFVETIYGTVLRPRTTPANPKTPAQEAARTRLASASAAFIALSPANRLLWINYAAGVFIQDKRGGLPHPARPQTVFNGLAAKYLQVHPGGAIPQTPPTSPFFGDSVTVTAAGGTGHITFTASAANGANVVTELLLQPLAHLSRAPKPNLYRPVSFAHFAAGSLSFSASVAPGAYAPAFRFVNSLTGQQTDLVRLAAVLVT